MPGRTPRRTSPTWPAPGCITSGRCRPRSHTPRRRKEPQDHQGHGQRRKAERLDDKLSRAVRSDTTGDAVGQPADQRDGEDRPPDSEPAAGDRPRRLAPAAQPEGGAAAHCRPVPNSRPDSDRGEELIETLTEREGIPYNQI